MKIYYACPDIAAPSGGVHTLYRHVACLRRSGFEAYVLHTQRFFRPRWFASENVDVRYRVDGEGPGPGDHLVIPEGEMELLRSWAMKGVHCTVFAQNWAYIWDTLKVGETWGTWNIMEVICVSEYMRAMIAHTMNLAAVVIHPGIPLPAREMLVEKQRQIVFMPRKNLHDTERIRKLFVALDRRHSAIPWIAVDGLRHELVYERLKESAIFLATGYPEGCPLPPLEAMACGCVVCGFDGMGMREYLEHGVNGYLVADGDAWGAAQQLSVCVAALESGAAASVVEAAQRTAAGFSLEREHECVVSYWRSRMERSARL